MLNKKVSVILFALIILSLSCVNKKPESQNAQKSKVLFDAVELLGKKPDEVDKILGTPHLIQPTASKTYPTLKSYYRWYKFEKDLAVFFDKDNSRDYAVVVRLIFQNNPKDSAEAASLLGIDLTGLKPKIDEDKYEEDYDDIQLKGKRVRIRFSKCKGCEDSISVSLERLRVGCNTTF